MEMTRATKLGLPSNDLRGYRLAFNLATWTVAVQVWVERSDLTAGEIYVRPRGATTYERVALPDEANISDESLITSDDGPYLFFIRQLGAKVASKDDVGWGFRFRGVVRLDLRSNHSEIFLTPAMAAGYEWVTALQSATSDGATVYAIVGSMTPPATRATYAISRIDLLDATVTPLVDLPAVFV